MRETGPVSKVLANEDLGLEGQDRTKPYIGPARTLLGILKNRMAMGELQQGRMVRDLPDGTRLIAESIFGLDKIHIIVPTPEPPEPELPQVEVPPIPEELLPLPEPPDHLEGIGSLMIVGYCTGASGTQATLWAGAKPPEALGDINSMALDISLDGTTIVGIGGGTLSTLSSYAWYWTRLEGRVQLPDIVGSRGETVAYGVSKTGRFICGYDTWDADGAFFNWVYDMTVGTHVILPGPGVRDIVRISPNGLWICAHDRVWHREDFDSSWELHTTLPAPGTTTQTGPDPLHPSTRPDTYILTDIADDGTACGYSDHVDVQTYHTRDTFTDNGGTRTTDTDWYTATYPLSQPVIRWTPDGGIEFAGLRGSTTQIAGATRDKTIAGNNATRFYYSEIVLFDIDEDIPGDHIHSVSIAYGFPGAVTDFGWVGARALGNGSSATGISDDGVIAIGGLRTGELTDPVYWRRNADHTNLSLLSGFDGGLPQAVTTKAGALKQQIAGPVVAPPLDSLPPDDLPADLDPTL